MPPPLQTALPNPLQTRLVKILWERGGPAPQRCHVHAMAWLWTCFQQKLAELHFLSFSHSSYSTHFQKDMRPLSSDARSKQRSFHVSTLPAWLLCGIASDFLSCDRTDSDSPHLGWGVGSRVVFAPQWVKSEQKWPFIACEAEATSWVARSCVSLCELEVGHVDLTALCLRGHIIWPLWAFILLPFSITKWVRKESLEPDRSGSNSDSCIS